MKLTALAISGVLLSSNLATAQPKPRTPDESEDDPAIQIDDESDDEATDAGDDADADAAPPPPRKHRHHQDEDRADDADDENPLPDVAPEPLNRRPERYSIGLGLGYLLPAELKAPNITSVRFRLASGVTYEPTLVLDHTSTKHDDGAMVTNEGANDIQIAVAVRYPFRHNDRVDFSMVAAAGLGRASTDPSGDANTKTTTTFALGYGLALDYWINPHWDLSMTASNPFLSTAKVSQQNGIAARDISTSETSFAAVFDPTLSVMIHMYL